MKKKLHDLPISDRRVMSVTRRPAGGTFAVLKCKTCGEETVVHVWSWAGRGAAFCGSRRHRLQYLNPFAK